MPTRVWLLGGGIVGVGLLAFIALVIAVPNPPSILTSPSAVSAPVAEAPPAEPAGPAPELVAAVAATAAARQALLPAVHIPVAGGPTALTLVTAASNQLTFAYEVEIDPADYDLPTEPPEFFHGLSVAHCAADPTRICFSVTPEFAADVCADPELRALIDRGAVVRALFRDINRRPLTDAAVHAADCP